MNIKMLELYKDMILAFFSLWRGDGKMNSFESDLLRAIFSKGFFVGFAIEFILLLCNGKMQENVFSSEIFRMSIPIICTLPYSCGWLNEYKHGFIKYSLSRSTFRGYICSKFFSAGIAGGAVEVLGVWVFVVIRGYEEYPVDYRLLFLSAFLWAVIATTLASASGSKYLAYGGSFVLYYFLVILHERYFNSLYCLSPYEWTSPTHIWMFGETGIMLLLAGLIMIVACIYYTVIRRRLDHV